jgi:hypothetical protein
MKGSDEMTVKQYLKQAYRLDALIDADLAELSELKQLALSVPSPSLSGMPSGGHKQQAPFVNPVQKIVDLEAHINSEVDRFVDLKTEIRYFLEQMQDNTQRCVLQYRYILFYSWNEIADKMGYTVQWVHQIHRDALISFDRVMKTTN